MAIREILLGGAIVVGFALQAKAETRTYDVADFTEIDISDGVAAVAEIGPDFSVTGEAVRGDINRLIIERDGDVLKIDRRRPGFLSGTRSDRFEVTITMPELTALNVDSGASLTASGHILTALDAEVSSGASLVVRGIEGGAFEADVSSGALIMVEGSCDDVQVDSSSGAAFSGSGLTCRTGDLEASSGGTIRVVLTETARADASSGASIIVDGGPEFLSSETKSGGSVVSN